MSRVQSFPPIVSEQSKLLILGSMPGAVSLKAGQYYAHPRNAFWSIMGELLGAGPSLPYQERVAMLQSVGVALWDSLQAGIRPAVWTRRSQKRWPTTFRPCSPDTRISRMYSSTAARRRVRFAVTYGPRCAKTTTSSRACHRPVPPMPRCDWKPNMAGGRSPSAKSRSKTQKQHFAALVAAQGLHGGIIEDLHGTTERTREIKSHPAVSEIVWFRNRPTAQNRTLDTRSTPRHTSYPPPTFLLPPPSMPA
jgi:hypoxanthine-DNA glycosylase